jgi:hypothetical protein
MVANHLALMPPPPLLAYALPLVRYKGHEVPLPPALPVDVDTITCTDR